LYFVPSPTVTSCPDNVRFFRAASVGQETDRVTWYQVIHQATDQPRLPRFWYYADELSR
jgi:hypothetical protein